MTEHSGTCECECECVCRGNFPKNQGKRKTSRTKKECSRCEGRGCVECAWSGWLWEEVEELKKQEKEK